MYRPENEFDFSELEWRKIIPYLIIVVIVIGVSLYILFAPAAEPSPEIPSRSIDMNTMGVTEIWRISSLPIGSIRDIVLTPESIIVYNGRLTSFKIGDGLLEWEINYNRGSASMVADDEKVYVASGGDPLQAFDLKTGELVWSGLELKPRMIHFLMIKNDVLIEDSDAIRLFDPKTGEFIREEKVITDNLGSFIVRLGDFDLRQKRDRGLIKMRKTGEFIWQTPLDNPSGLAHKYPILSNNKLITVVGRIGFDLYVIDFETGQRLWKADGTFVSNAVVLDGKIYILRDDARLMVYDEVTGAELGHIQFTPAETDPAGKIYWIGVSDQGRIFVYFSDSDELIGLEPN